MKIPSNDVAQINRKFQDPGDNVQTHEHIFYKQNV